MRSFILNFIIFKHRLLFFKQWLSYYIRHVKNSFKAHMWAKRNNIPMNVYEMFGLYLTMPWSVYRDTQTYFFNRKGTVWLVRYSNFKETIKSIYDR